jgi:uncharacterized protein YlxW (UPF0749 family)
MAGLALVNIWLLKKNKSGQLNEQNAKAWEALYRSEEQKYEKELESHQITKESLRDLNNKVIELTEMVHSLKHMPDFNKIYTLLAEHHQYTMTSWEEVRTFIKDKVRIIEMDDRRGD